MMCDGKFIKNKKAKLESLNNQTSNSYTRPVLIAMKEAVEAEIKEIELIISECENQNSQTSENNLNISDVSSQRELLIAFAMWQLKPKQTNDRTIAEKMVDLYLSN